MNSRLAFTINADHYQFYLEDERARPAYERLWTKETYADRIAVLPGIVAVGTARYGQAIPVEVEIRDGPPEAEPFEAWDHVVECALDTASGRLRLSDPGSLGMGVPQFQVPPGTYRVRIYYANLDSVWGGGDLDGDDRYRIVLWPGTFISPQVLKRKPVPDA